MVTDALAIIGDAFGACVLWLDALLSAVDGKHVVLGALLIVFVASLILMPLRGGSPVFNSALSDFASNTIHRGKFSSGGKRSNYSKMGKFEKGNHRARSDRELRHRNR